MKIGDLLEALSGSWHWVVTAVLTPVGLALVNILGGWTPAMTAMAIIVSLDLLSGLVRAFVQKRLSSSISWPGVAKKILILIIVALSSQIDNLAGSNHVIRDAAVIFFGVGEGLSVIENAAAAGLPVPDFLREALAQLNEKKAAPPTARGTP
jgi:toxin secretion/phage lysis holin